MTAQDFPVTFGYGEKMTLNGAPYTHRGTDRRCPIGTPVHVGGVLIGKTGNSGLVTGPHIHLQAGTDQACQKTFNPERLAFKPGTVVITGTGKQWGKFVTVRVGNEYISYCHLSEVKVKAGDKLQGEPPMNAQEENEAYQIVLERPMEHGGSGRTGLQFIRDARGELNNRRTAQSKLVADLQAALQNEQSKPPKEVVKEVEKIVERIVEVEKIVEKIIEVEKPVSQIIDTTPQWLKTVIEVIKKLLKKG